MKNNFTKDSRRIKMAVVAVIIVFAMVISLVVPIFAATAKAVRYYEASTTEVAIDGEETEETKIAEEDKAVLNDAIEIKAEVGFDGVYMINRQTPVKVTVYNMGSDFKGTVEVKVFTNINTMYTPASYIKYEQDADIASGGAGEYNFVVYPEAQATYMNIRLVDESGNVEASVNKTVTPCLPEQVMTAVLTDSKATGIDYLKSLTIGEDIYNNRSGYVTNYVVFLDKDSLPETSDVLKCFGAIIIEDFHSASLSDKQKGALANWAEDGGLLVIGTGLSAEKTLNGLEEIFDFTINGYSTALCFGGTADTADIYIPDAEATEIQGGKELTNTLDYGNGKIIVHSFALSSDPIASMANRVDYLSQFYRNTMPDKFSANRNYDYYPQNYISAVNRLPSIEKSRLMMLLAILFVYIIAVGPICYLVLKKKDRRERGWVAIPAVSVLFAVIIFVISMSSYQKDSLVNFVTFTDLDSASPVTQAAIGFRTPDKGDVTLSFDDSVNICDNGNYYYDYSYSSTDLTKSKCMYSVKTEGNKTSITYFDQNSWNDNSFNTTLDHMEDDALDAEFTVKGSSIVGTIYNNLDYDLFDVIIGFGGQYQKVGYIEAGGKLDVSVPMKAEEYQKWMDNSWQMLRQMMFGLSEDEYQPSMVFRKGVSAIEAYKAEQRFEIFNNRVFDRSADLRENEFKISVAAFSEKRLIEGNKEINGKLANENWENLYLKNFDIDINASDEYDIPYGYIFPKKIYLDGTSEQQYWDLYYYQLYTMSAKNFKCEYDLPVYGNVTSVSVDWSNYDAFDGEPKIYNYNSETWENLKEATVESDPSPYISSEGKLTLMSDVFSDTYLTLPKIRLKGGK